MIQEIKNEDRAFCDQGLKNSDGKRRIHWEAGDVEGEERGSEEPDSLWVIVLSWLQLVASSLEARALE